MRVTVGSSRSLLRTILVRAFLMIPPLTALFAWPIISAAIFSAQRLPYAIAITIIAGYLLLPTVVYYNLPLLPTLDKHSVPSLCAFFLALMFGSRMKGRPGWLPRNIFALGLLSVLFGGVFFTTITNSDPIQIGSRLLAGLRLYDSFAEVLGAFIMVLPFLLARKYLAGPEAHKMLLWVFAISAMAYMPLAWIELRMSPQMSNWVYGFFPHSWIQHVRGGGYRPVVFMEHGLRLAIFLSAGILATFALIRIFPERKGQLTVGVVLLIVTLILAKSLGAMVISLFLVPILLFLKMRTQLLVASAIGLIVLAYPATRAANLIPTDRVEAAFARISPDRAASLGYRLQNEDILLQKAAERPIFGWGGWGRSRVYSEFGRDISTTDGIWVIAFGVGGWVRYLSLFGLMVLPLVFLLVRSRDLKLGHETTALALILTGNLVDMIPNASMTPVTWLVVGAIWGRLELATKEVSETDGVPPELSSQIPSERGVYARSRDQAVETDRQGTQYSRFPAKGERRDTEPARSRNTSRQSLRRSSDLNNSGR